MRSAAAHSASLSEIAAALRETTETLARELTTPGNRAPLWSEFEWQIARAVTAMHGVSSLLCTNLRWQGPASWQRFLDEQRDHTLRRHQKISQLLERIDAHSRREGIAMLALKGAALHAAGIYQAGERPMADIDLLVRPGDREAAARLLERCGYSTTALNWRHQTLQPLIQAAPSSLGEHRDNSIKIELHTRIMEPLPIRETDITSFLLPGPMPAGLNAYPSAAALMSHLLLHAAGNMRARALRLIQLHDIARLAVRFSDSDWAELRAARPHGKGLWWAAAPLTLTARYYPATIPRDYLAQLQSECPWLLAKLSRRHQLVAVSWSNLRIQAFPGIEWARTPLEALRFAISRIWPSRGALRDLQVFTTQNPPVATIPWYGISHGARILRWIFSRPPRVQTMLTVRAALAQDSSHKNISAVAKVSCSLSQ